MSSDGSVGYMQALILLHDHRDRYGDDVVLHQCEEHDGYFMCDDCAWVCSFVRPEPYSGLGSLA